MIVRRAPCRDEDCPLEEVHPVHPVRWIRCPVCDGAGSKAEDGAVRACPGCGGSGQLHRRQAVDAVREASTARCPRCGGAKVREFKIGRRRRFYCASCDRVLKKIVEGPT